MTTNNENIEVVETETESETTQRSVAVLLNILQTENTFQGMTDAEIQSIIDYEKNMSYMRGQSTQQQSSYTDYHTTMQSRMDAALQEQQSMLESIMNRASNSQSTVVQYG